MNEFRPALVRRTAKWRLDQHKMSTVQSKTASSFDYQSRSRTIFREDCETESIEKIRQDRETLRKRRKQVDCLTLAKERAELMLFWATMKRKESQAIDIKEINFRKTQQSLTLRVINPSFKINLLKDQISKVVVAHKKTLSARNHLQLTDPIQLKPPQFRITPAKTKMHSSRLRLATLQKSKGAQSDMKGLSSNLQVSAWQTSDEPWLF